MNDEYIKKDDLIKCLKSEINNINCPYPTTAMKWKRNGFSHALAIVENFDTVSFSSLSESAENKGEITALEAENKTLRIKLENAEDVLRGLKEDLADARAELRERR